jgi:hypothetical protein
LDDTTFIFFIFLKEKRYKWFKNFFESHKLQFIGGSKMEKKINLEILFDRLRSLADEYDTEEDNQDLFVLKDKELNSFADDLSRLVNHFIKSEVISEEEMDLEFTETATEDDELYIDDWFDDDLD